MEIAFYNFHIWRHWGKDYVACDIIKQTTRLVSSDVIDVPSRIPITLREPSILVELHGMLLGLWIRGEPHQRDTLVDLDYSGVQRGRAPYVEVKDLGAGLVSD